LFTDAECCPHVTKVILERKAEHRAKAVEYGKNFATNQDRLLAHLEKQAEASMAERSMPAGKKAPLGG
jgi:hypothetical protein